MEASNGPSNNTLLMMFGVPIVTTAVVCSSMYVGHLLTKRAYQRSAQAAAASASVPRPPAPAPKIEIPVAAAQPVPASAPVARAQVVVAEEKIEPRAVIAPVAAPAPEVPAPAAPANILPNAAAPVSAPAPAVPVPPARKPSALKPPAIPTPLLVPGKSTQKSSRLQRDTKPYPQRVVPDTRTAAKPAHAPSPAPAAPSPLTASVPAVVSEPAPAKPAIVIELEEPAPAPLVIAPKRETNSDVAVAETVRRAPLVEPAPVAPAPLAPAPVQPAPRISRPVAQPVAALPAAPAPSNEGRMILASSPVHTPAAAPAHKGLLLGRPVREEDLSLDLLYALSKKYVEAYCIKQGKNPAEEQQRWTKRWMDNVEQALMDGDSSEQQFINRVTIAKRDCFNIEKATPEKIVEGCRILLRYREGNFAWLSAMREALTRENLLKTLNFLNAGPQS